MPVEAFPVLAGPSLPHLGAYKRRKLWRRVPNAHQNIHVELNPSIDFNPRRHQMYFRVVEGSGEALRRCLVYMTPDLKVSPMQLSSSPADAVLGGDSAPNPSDWRHFKVQQGERFYWFYGQARHRDRCSWEPDTLVFHDYEIYENGTLSTLCYEVQEFGLARQRFVLQAAIVGVSMGASARAQRISRDMMATEHLQVESKLV